jgi:uncharacterized protein
VTAPPPISPCTAVCIIDPASGFCRGCTRTIGEIAGWLGFSDAEKQRILAALPERQRRARSGLNERRRTP